MHNDLYQAIVRANSAINQIHEMIGQEIDFRNMYGDTQKEVKRLKRQRRQNFIFMPLLILPLCALNAALWLPIGIIEEIVSNIGGTVLINIINSFSGAVYYFLFEPIVDNGPIGLIVLSVTEMIIIFLITLFLPPKYNQYIYQAEAYIKEANRIRIEIKSLIETNEDALSILPSKYRYPLASNFIVELFELERVTSLPDAYDKLEEQLHRWSMESAMSTMITLQTQTLQRLENIEYNTSWI